MSSGNILEIHVTKYNSVCMYTSVKNVIPKKSTKKQTCDNVKKQIHVQANLYEEPKREEKYFSNFLYWQ